MLAAIVWGLVQGLTEFLPVSSSGHLVIVPEFLDQVGVEISPPSLAVSAVLHLGTLLAVLIYFRDDLMKVIRFRDDPEGRTIALLVAVGTIPAVVGLPLKDTLESIQENVTYVGVALVATGIILVIGQLFANGVRRLIDGRIPDAVVVGVAQAFALIPGISRSGITIAAGNGRSFSPTEAARFSFLLGIPAIAGAGLVSLPDLFGAAAIGWELVVGTLVAAVSGYAAIAFLLAALRRVGLVPFAVYALLVGGLTVAFL
ncbi:MAG TPA: undecaprenyl-diphosphate phosphatase [Acidimicrobiia bacterium]|nr:undecaprenyl-diphosphate phosphatase [Acidimicrobiia bacterium]